MKHIKKDGKKEGQGRNKETLEPLEHPHPRKNPDKLKRIRRKRESRNKEEKKTE